MRVLRTIGFDRTWARAEGAYLYDTDGTRYLDVLGGFGMYNVGRNNPRIRAALIESLELGLPGAVQLGVTALPGLLAEALLARTPDRLERVLFTSTGTEAVEAALKLGRAATKRTRVLSAEHGFHGLTLGSLSANGNPEFTARFGPLLPGFDRVPFGDLDALEAQLRSEDVAVFLVEPIQGKGVHLPPAGYLEGAQALCRTYGTLFCVDEVQTGFGRTGTMFAFEHWGLEPDLVPVAKSLSGGYVPVGALLMSRAVHEAVYDSMENAVAHGSTFAPNELAMAAGLATLHELDEQELVARSARLGDRLLELTRPLVDEFDVVQEVRGARADVGDRVRRAREVGAPFVADDREDAAGPLRAARRRPALRAAQDPEPGRRPSHGCPEGAAAARRHRRGRRLLRRGAHRHDQARTADAVVADALRADRRRNQKLELATELAELGPRMDALARPLLREREQLGIVHLARHLDHDLPHRRLDVAAELVPLLRDDRERLHLVVQQPREVVDLRLRRVATREQAEVHAHFDGRPLVLRHPECNRLLHYPSRGSHRNFNAATTNPDAPQAASTPSARPFVQIDCRCRYTAFSMSIRYFNGRAAPIQRRTSG